MNNSCDFIFLTSSERVGLVIPLAQSPLLTLILLILCVFLEVGWWEVQHYYCVILCVCVCVSLCVCVCACVFLLLIMLVKGYSL